MVDEKKPEAGFENPEDVLQRAREILLKLPPKTVRTKGAIIASLAGDIEKAMESGHKIAEIATALAGADIQITPPTLRYYLSVARKTSAQEREKERTQESETPKKGSTRPKAASKTPKPESHPPAAAAPTKAAPKPQEAPNPPTQQPASGPEKTGSFAIKPDREDF